MKQRLLNLRPCGFDVHPITKEGKQHKEQYDDAVSRAGRYVCNTEDVRSTWFWARSPAVATTFHGHGFSSSVWEPRPEKKLSQCLLFPGPSGLAEDDFADADGLEVSIQLDGIMTGE